MTTPVPVTVPNGGTVEADNLVTSIAIYAAVTVSATGVPSAAIADPTTVTLKVQESGGAVTTYVYPNAFITKVATGIYTAEIDTTGQSGPTSIQWVGAGAVQAIKNATWNVTPAPL